MKTEAPDTCRGAGVRVGENSRGCVAEHLEKRLCSEPCLDPSAEWVATCAQNCLNGLDSCSILRVTCYMKDLTLLSGM